MMAPNKCAIGEEEGAEAVRHAEQGEAGEESRQDRGSATRGPESITSPIAAVALTLLSVTPISTFSLFHAFTVLFFGRIPRTETEGAAREDLYGYIGAPCENEPALTTLWFHINELAAWAGIHQA